MSSCEKCGGSTTFIKILNMHQTVCDSCYVSEKRRCWYIVNSFKRKLSKIGIEVELSSNVPWIYLDRVNGIDIREHFMSDGCFTAFWYPIRMGEVVKFTDIKKVFEIVRKSIS